MRTDGNRGGMKRECRIRSEYGVSIRIFTNPNKYRGTPLSVSCARTSSIVVSRTCHTEAFVNLFVT